MGAVALFRMGKRLPVVEHHFCQPGAPRVRHGRGPAVFRPTRRFPGIWGACSVVERSVNYGSLEPRFGMKVSASCNSYACRPASFCRRLLRVSRAPRACCRQLSIHFPEDRARCREPAPSVNERSFPARPGTGSTETTQGMGRVAAKMYTVTGSSMTAELLHPTTVIHHFPTHAARTGAVERSDERLNLDSTWNGMYYYFIHFSLVQRVIVTESDEIG